MLPVIKSLFVKYLIPVIAIIGLLLHIPGLEVLSGGPMDSVDPGQRVLRIDGGKGRDGFQIFYPSRIVPTSSKIVVFLHGYGGYNPMVYGGWIDHLVASGQTVIFPYYQDNMIRPAPEAFAGCASGAIHRAFKVLQDSLGLSTPAKIHYIGHSFGGVIAAQLSAAYDSFGLAPPATLLLCMAGTGLFKDGLLPDYESIPSDCILGVVVGKDDRVVGDKFSKMVYRSANRVQRKFWIALDKRDGDPNLTGGHNEACSRHPDYDNGIRNYNYARTIFFGQADKTDSLAFWRTYDWMFEKANSTKPGWMDKMDRNYLTDLGKDSRGGEYGPMHLHCGELFLPKNR